MDENKKPLEGKKDPLISKWVTLAFLIAFAIFMYASIMYKIMVYGP